MGGPEQELAALREENQALRLRVAALRGALLEAHAEIGLMKDAAVAEGKMLTERLEALREAMRMRGVIR